MTDAVQVEIRGPAAWIWLNRPARLNAMNQVMLDELRSAFESLAAHEAVRVAVIAGRGGAFSAGFDVEWMAGLSAETVEQELDGVRAVYDAIEAFPRPLIAAIGGAAAGGGLLLALVADFRLAAQDAVFRVPEIKIGIFPSLDLVPRLERVVGLGTAKWLVLTGEPLTAGEALRTGLVYRVVPAGELQAEAETLAARLAALPAAALRLSKAAFAASRLPGYPDWERKQFAAGWILPEREAAMRAFLKRR